MLLGALLSRLEDEAFARRVLAGLGDDGLLARMAAAGAPFGEAPGAYATGACERFARAAGDEDWLALMTALERSADPAAACLRNMVEWALKDDAAAHAAGHAGAQASAQAAGQAAGQAGEAGCGGGGGGGCGCGGGGHHGAR